MQCPVCDGPGKDITAPDYDGYSVRCPKCGNFNIADGYEVRLTKLVPEDRLGVLLKAKRFAAPRTRPCISGTCF